MKPDFFLPFHLPMIIPKTNILNIDFKLTTDNLKALCKIWDVSIVELENQVFAARLKNGCYQTIMTTKEQAFFMQTFSISLN